ncbi:MAG TPA: ArsR family transcriptional regulator [Pyrinomonadaceae bacterium]|nr:ArsR family transcriptional regulator [Pyrinomonadaceae bacterium]
MPTTKLDTRFFESTRGQIVLLLRESSRTVNEIAEKVDLTDNAVRSHLIALERDGLVTSVGTTKGFRKPHSVYGLTDEARHIFPKHYDSILNKLLTVLKSRLAPKELLEIMRDVGRSVAGEDLGNRATSLNERVKTALLALESLGGAARIVERGDRLSIESDSCPFADVVAEHPEVCKATESAVQEIVGVKVSEKCDRTGLPKCRFAIDAK